jgi:hypothetical protein
MNEITIDELLNNLNSVKNNIKKTINSKKIESIGDSDFITEDTKFSEYSFQIEDKLTRKLPPITIKVQVDESSNGMGNANINGYKGYSEVVIPFDYECVIHAVPLSGYLFEKWIDNNGSIYQNNPLLIKAQQDNKYTVYFKIDKNYTPTGLNTPLYIWNGSNINDGDWEREIEQCLKNPIYDLEYVYKKEDGINQYIIFMIPPSTEINVKFESGDDNTIISSNITEQLEKITDSHVYYEILPQELRDKDYHFSMLSFKVDALSENTQLRIQSIVK